MAFSLKLRSGFSKGSKAAGLAVWTPAELFASSEEGVWYDPSDLSTVFQDNEMTVPSGVGDAVVAIKDKSGNNKHATGLTGCFLVKGFDGRYAIRLTNDASPISKWQTPELTLVSNFSFFFAGHSVSAELSGQGGFFNFQRTEGSLATDSLLQNYFQAGTHATYQRYPSLYTVSSEATTYLPGLPTPFVASGSLGTNFLQKEVWEGGRTTVHDEGAKTLPTVNETGNLRIGYGYNDARYNWDIYGFIWINKEVNEEDAEITRAWLVSKADVKETLYLGFSPIGTPTGLVSATDLNGTYDAFGFGMQAADGTHIYFGRRAATLHVGDEGSILKWAYNESTGWATTTVKATSGMDVRNAAGGKSSNGDIFLFYGNYDYDGLPAAWDSIEVIKSTDDGSTWGSPVSIDTRSHDSFSPYGPLVQLPSGKLMQTVYGITGAVRESWVTFSDDAGETWGNEVSIVSDTAANGLEINETAACLISGSTDATSKIIAVARNEETGILRQYISADGGQTWTDKGNIYFGENKSSLSPVEVSPWLYLDGETIHMVWADRSKSGFFHSEGVAQDVFTSPDNWNTPYMPCAKLAGTLIDFGYPSFYKDANGDVVLFLHDKDAASTYPVIKSTIANP